MTSFNHYAYGSIADWMHRTIGGLEPLQPGYARVRIAPQPGGGITSAETSLQSLHGPISVKWRVTDDTMSIETELPVGVTAELILPGCEAVELGGGSHEHATGLA